MTLSDLSIRRPVFAWMLMTALMVFGLISFKRLGISKLPDVDFPTISIRLSWEGAAPEVMETDVVDVVEESVTAIQGVRDISSTIRQGQATISLELDLDRDIDVAVQEVQTKLLQAQRQLPREIDPAVVTKVNPEDQPIMWITVTGDVPLRDIMDYAQNQLEDRFATVNGVGEVFLGGLLERNLRIWIDAKKLELNQLTIKDVVAAIEKGHQEIPAGRIETETKEFNVRAMGEALNTEEFGNIIIDQRGGRPNYKPIYLKDVAAVEDGLADQRRISRRSGELAVGLGIRKQRGVNTVEVGRRVLSRLKEVQKDVPPGMKVALTVNNVKFIEDSIKELNLTLISSAFVTSLVCWLFLGSVSATINVLLAIPTSILGTFIFLYFIGFTLNTFTMLGLSLAIGIVVDDAIMVLENIVRYREKGMDRVQAAQVGARQITFAAIATSLAIIAIFLPVAFMTGIMGKFFYEFGVTISIAVAISLLEALTLTPMRCSQFLRTGERKTSVGKFMESSFQQLAHTYQKSLRWVLNRRLLVLILALISFAVSLILLFVIRKEFIPPQDQSMFFVRLQTPVGSSINLTDGKFKEVEQYIRTRPEVRHYFCAIGGFGGGEVNSGQIFVILQEPRERPITPPFQRRPTQKDLMDLFRKELKKISDVKVVIQDPSLSGFSSQRGFPIEVTILGPEWDQLAHYSNLIEEKMAAGDLMIDVDSNYQAGVPEIRVYPDRQKASERGVAVDDIGQTINSLIAGERVAKYTQGGRRYDVRVRLIPSQRSKAEDIHNLWVWNNRGELVQLKDVVRIEEKSTPLSITRSNRERAIKLNANVAPGKSQTDALQAVQSIVKEVLPERYRASFSGNTQTFQESFRSLSFVLWLGILVAYMVLASQFNSYKDPFIVLLALPFSISGALVALWVTGQSLNIYSFIGIVLLMGIVKKNSILLVDFTNQLREQGVSPQEALFKACPTRLRPILMTSFSTIAAAVPPALALGPGAEVMKPMATTVIGGMIVSTFFTLLVIPCVYSLLDRFERKRFLEEGAVPSELPKKGQSLLGRGL